MKQIYNYILEKLHLDKDSKMAIPSEDAFINMLKEYIVSLDKPKMNFLNLKKVFNPKDLPKYRNKWPIFKIGIKDDKYLMGSISSGHNYLIYDEDFTDDQKKCIYNYMQSKLNGEITEKLHINKDTKKPDSKLLKKYEMVEDPNTIETIKFVLDFVNRSRLDKFNNSVFHYWEMWINRSEFHCMHTGWSHDNLGFRYSRYVEKVVDNYNNRHGTDIKCRVSGWSADAYDGISILEIKEIVDALKKKYNDFKPDKDKELISINI